MRTLDLKSILGGVADYIEDQSNDLLEIGINLFKGTMPDKPAKCTVVAATGGPRIKGDPIHRPRLQVTIRDPDYSVGIARAQSIFDQLDHKVISLGTVSCRVRPESEPGTFVRDANDMFLFILNFSLVLPSV